MRPIPRPTLALAALGALAAGCGGLASPDLQTGEVSGTVAGAKAGAYAYVLGAPGLRAAVEDGAFRLERVPVGTAQVVVFDGEARAELVAVEVRPASRSRLARDAAAMPLAARVVPVPRPVGGSAGATARCSVDGTALADVPAVAAGGLFPLPAGQFSLRAALPGFKTSAKLVAVPEAASLPVEVELEIDDAAPLRGCLAGTPCEVGLVCAGDGRCYECTQDADCGAGGVCSAEHVCANRPLGCGEPCAAGDACRAGLTCSGGTCQAIAGCAAWMQSFGSACRFEPGYPGTCAQSLAGGRCWVAPGLSGEAAEVGYCTAPCATGAQCPTSYACDATAGVCVR
ncbi:hypothetical protein [Anaeromyxobacter diazotrophicus]|uniref:PEGA domain-containing protein n=1 Tax=Anaeromyxobacter diazotrophicus TaxID=2590199 RepID=A0A7I9VJ84_9BACT|nr:hypothetical protein [Anaeromyxobacter diazotrophicus]GEJ56425.1 hypothetical protein AMYX_11660 [Anaeromyxobacter diazotrophicus]